MMFMIMCMLVNTGADPGSVVGERQPIHERRQPNTFLLFPKNMMKLKKFSSRGRPF